MIRRYLAYRPSEVGRIYRLLDIVKEGCPGNGPVHLLVASATGIGFQWDPHMLGWVRPGLFVLSNLAGPIQLTSLRFFMLAKTSLLQTSLLGKGFEAVRFSILLVPCSSLTLPMFGRETKRCSGVCWSVGLEWFLVGQSARTP